VEARELEKNKVGPLLSCASCVKGKGPFTTLGIAGKCYCTRTRNYEKSTHFCAEWKIKTWYTGGKDNASK
jgi:hypothetical protein